MKNKKSACCGTLLFAFLLCAVGVLIVWWYFNRPVEPTVLSQDELVAVEQKVDLLSPNSSRYQPGSNTIIFTERELNGLINEHTDLAERLRFEIDPGALNAYYHADLTEETPLLGGRRVKLKMRATIEMTDSRPNLVIEDVTAWGVSLPKDWLGGLKGENLLGQIAGDDLQNRLPGIEKIELQSEQLTITLKE